MKVRPSRLTVAWLAATTLSLVMGAGGSALGQGTATLMPRLQDAALPHYPAIAEAAHVTGKVVVAFLVERGRVIKADVQAGSPSATPAITRYLQPATLENVRTWRFGTDVNGSFTVTYEYEFAGTRSEAPTNPKVEMLPSLDVKVTARPMKLTCSDGPCQPE